MAKNSLCGQTKQLRCSIFLWLNCWVLQVSMKEIRLTERICTVRVRSTREGNVFTLFVSSSGGTPWSFHWFCPKLCSRYCRGGRGYLSFWFQVPSQSLVPCPFWEMGPFCHWFLSKVRLQVSPGGGGGNPDRTRGYPPPSRRRVMLCRGWYASCGHAGKLSCWLSFWYLCTQELANLDSIL